MAHPRADHTFGGDIIPDDVRRSTCGLQHAVRGGDDKDGTAVDRYLGVLLQGLRP